MLCTVNFFSLCPYSSSYIPLCICLYVSEIFLTKVILQNILYPTGGNAYEQQIQNINQQPSDMNNYQYIVTNTKNDPVYGLKPRIEVQGYDTSHGGESDGSMYVHSRVQKFLA